MVLTNGLVLEDESEVEIDDNDDDNDVDDDSDTHNDGKYDYDDNIDLMPILHFNFIYLPHDSLSI